MQDGGMVGGREGDFLLAEAKEVRLAVSGSERIKPERRPSEGPRGDAATSAGFH